MNVFVVTYNTNDKPDRRMIWSVRKNKADAEADRQIFSNFNQSIH